MRNARGWAVLPDPQRATVSSPACRRAANSAVSSPAHAGDRVLRGVIARACGRPSDHGARDDRRTCSCGGCWMAGGYWVARIRGPRHPLEMRTSAVSSPAHAGDPVTTERGMIADLAHAVDTGWTADTGWPAFAGHDIVWGG